MEEEAWDSPDTAVPMVNHEKEYQLIDISEDGYLDLLNFSGDTKDDVKLPKDALGETIRKLFVDDGKDLTVTVKVTIENGEPIEKVIKYKLL
ncbi:translation initiation factor eIF5A [Neurospora sp. IMI 360204]|nr:translation initiation factor eIF5A [Neurospora sp. IMI 360204]